MLLGQALATRCDDRFRLHHRQPGSAQCGSAAWVAGGILGFGELTPWVALVLIYVLTAVFTEMITNNAAAVLMFPIALAVSQQLGVNFLPYAVAVMFAASASFITPLGYQTNLMVFGPGRYRFGDYVRIGLPLSLLAGGARIPPK